MDAGDVDKNQLTAYELGHCKDGKIVPASLRREWMTDSPGQYAYHCLPLVVANQMGWFLLSPVTFTATWDGSDSADGVKIEFEDGYESSVKSHFGCGIITFDLPFLFRSPPGINLWVKGPANRIKDGVQALEGVVETDWLSYTFTMNWKLTRPGLPVMFGRDEPICMIVPIKADLLESLQPVRRPIKDNPDLEAASEILAQSRERFEHSPERAERGWQRNYLNGIIRARLNVKEFRHVGMPDP